VLCWGGQPDFELSPAVIPMSMLVSPVMTLKSVGLYIMALANLMTRWAVRKPNIIEDLAFV